MEKKERVYPKGLIGFKPHEKAPSFVLGKVCITLNDLIAWCKENPQHLTDYKGNKQLVLQITSGDKGVSFSVDDFKPSEKKAEKDDLLF